MCVAVASGLFDSAVNYAWNAAIMELREKVRRFGLAVVPQVIDRDFDEARLVDLKDSELLELCLKLNLISEDGFFLLDQCRDIRNNFSAAHPTMGNLDEDEFLNFLSRCARHALTNENNPRGVDIKAFIAAIKASRFNEEQRHTWCTRLDETFAAQREALFGTLHGFYCDPTAGEEARVNSLEVFAPFRERLSPQSRSDLIDRHQEYRAKGDDVRSKASSQFFEKLGLLSLLGESELHLIITTASNNLLAVHNAMNNFYNEPPFAARLEQISSQNRVPATAQPTFVQAVVTCGTGNPMGHFERGDVLVHQNGQIVFTERSWAHAFTSGFGDHRWKQDRGNRSLPEGFWLFGDDGIADQRSNAIPRCIRLVDRGRLEIIFTARKLVPRAS
jgi:hypothetical protein